MICFGFGVWYLLGGLVCFACCCTGLRLLMILVGLGCVFWNFGLCALRGWYNIDTLLFYF